MKFKKLVVAGGLVSTSISNGHMIESDLNHPLEILENTVFKGQNESDLQILKTALNDDNILNLIELKQDEALMEHLKFNMSPNGFDKFSEGVIELSSMSFTN